MAVSLVERRRVPPGRRADPAGLLAVGVATQQHAFGERQLVAGLARQDVQVDVQHALKRRRRR